MRRRIERDRTPLDDRRRAAGAAAQQRADPRRELGQLERLDDVVVGARVEALDAIGDRVARGDDQHRPRVAAPAQRAQHVEAFLARQPEVEQHEVVDVLGERHFGGAAVAHPVDREAVLPQTAADRLADHRVVFGEQQAHPAGTAAPARARQDFGSNLSAQEFMQ